MQVTDCKVVLSQLGILLGRPFRNTFKPTIAYELLKKINRADITPSQFQEVNKCIYELIMGNYLDDILQDDRIDEQMKYYMLVESHNDEGILGKLLADYWGLEASTSVGLRDVTGTDVDSFIAVAKHVKLQFAPMREELNGATCDAKATTGELKTNHKKRKNTCLESEEKARTESVELESEVAGLAAALKKNKLAAPPESQIPVSAKPFEESMQPLWASLRDITFGEKVAPSPYSYQPDDDEDVSMQIKR